MMFMQLYIKYEDIEKYNNGEEIVATDKSGSSVVLKGKMDDIMEVYVNTLDIVEKTDYVSRGFVNGTFNKFLIKKH